MGEIPTIFDSLEWFSFLRGEPTGYLLVLTAFLILVISDLRWSLFALLAQYLLVGLLLVDVLLPHLALLKVLAGIFVCLILFITARQVNWGKLPDDVTAEEETILVNTGHLRMTGYSLKADFPFRLILGVLIVIGAWTLVENLGFRLPIVPDYFNLAIICLIALGLVITSLTSEPLKAGMGLLTFLTGFELIFGAFEQSGSIIVLFAATILILSLAISYLAQARHAYSAMLD